MYTHIYTIFCIQFQEAWNPLEAINESGICKRRELYQAEVIRQLEAEAEEK
jgi:hypothetical protein